MIKLIQNPLIADAITHNGKFHADDIMATVVLEKVFNELCLCRVSSLPEKFNKSAVIYDIGGGNYDHHQKGGNGLRPNGIPYASAGLIWKAFGPKLVKNTDDPQAVWQIIDEELIQGIDAEDNGFSSASGYVSECMNLSKTISLFNLNWDEKGSVDDAFMEAVNLAEDVFDKVYANVLSRIKARGIVEVAIKESNNHIMVLDKYVPWQEWLFQSLNPKAKEIHFVIYPAVRGGFNWQCVPDFYGGFGQRKSVPEEWRGLSGSELIKVTGVNSAIFCHAAGFIGSTETFDDAYKMVELAENFEGENN